MVKSDLASELSVAENEIGAETISRKVRVLIFVDRFLRGGIQTLLWNISEIIDRDRFDITFLSLDDGAGTYPMENDLRRKGYRVEKLEGIWLRSPIDYVRYYIALKRFFESHPPFDAVHMHSSSKNFPILQTAEQHGVPVRIAHSHNTDYQTDNVLKKKLGGLFSLGIKRYSTRWLACSTEAGQWMFGPSFNSSPKAHVMRNALPLERYRFSIDIRSKVREKLHFGDDKLVIINVARLSRQKNQAHLLSIFSKLVLLREDSVLLLVGEGELGSSLQQEARRLGIADKVKFLGFRDDVRDLLMAADVMVMPSFHEGLPYAAIEAQATGLPCVFSSSISPEAIILPCSSAISLDETLVKWASTVSRLPGSFDRSLAGGVLREHGFDLEQEVKKLESIYCESLSSTCGAR